MLWKAQKKTAMDRFLRFFGNERKKSGTTVFSDRENTAKWTAQHRQAQEPAEKTTLRLWGWDKWLLEAHIINVPSSYFSVSHHIALSTISKAWILKHKNQFYNKHAWWGQQMNIHTVVSQVWTYLGRAWLCHWRGYPGWLLYHWGHGAWAALSRPPCWNKRSVKTESISCHYFSQHCPSLKSKKKNKLLSVPGPRFMVFVTKSSI